MLKPGCNLETAGRIASAQTGLFKGNETVPLERIGIAGFAVFNVAPNG